MRFLLILPVFLLCWVTAPLVYSQQEFDVRQMKISIPQSSAPQHFELFAVDSSGNPVNYIVPDSGAFEFRPGYTQCTPCSAPQLFATNTFSNPISIALSSHSLISIKFFLALNESPPIYLNSRVFSRRSDFTINGRMRLQGRIEIVNGVGAVLYFDNSVTLEGTYTSLFWKPYLTQQGRRLTDFKGIVYDLSKVP